MNWQDLSTVFFIFVTGCLIGGVIGYFLKLKTTPFDTRQFFAELKTQFKTVAYDMLDDQRQKNQSDIGALLRPFRDNLNQVSQRIENFSSDLKGQNLFIAEQIKQNHEITTNLTKALTHSSKTMGNWGEFALEQLLENSGLRKGENYELQKKYSGSDGSVLQPDCVLLLPDKKHIIIDAKVSLADYERSINHPNDKEKIGFIRNHVIAVRKHIQELAAKNYATIDGLNCLDFVLMFVPIEPAYILAVSQDADLWDDARRKNILLISPSSLIIVLRTVATLWRQEAQNKNAKEIARQAGQLYDKFVGFLEDMKNIGTNLDRAKNSYDESLKKLKTGKGSLTAQTEKLKKLGVNTNKNIESNMLNDE